MDRLGWAARFTVKVGDYYLGIRSNSEQVDERLRRLLAPYVADGVEAPANLSVQIIDEAPAGQKPFHFLYFAHSQVVRARSPRRVVLGLLARLEFFARPADLGGLLRVDALGLVGDGRALLAPNSLRDHLPAVERRLQRAGLAVVDTPQLQLDPATAEVVVAGPTMAADWSGVNGSWASVDPSELVLPGRYRVGAWVLSGVGPDGEILSPARGVLAAASLVGNLRAVGAQQALDGLARVFAAARPVALERRSPRLAEVLTAAAD